jgi:hypothetical protein
MTIIRPLGAVRQPPQIFWGEIAPCEHMVQLYEDGAVFLDTLHGFVASGLETGDSVVVIATGGHLVALERRLRESGINVLNARSEDRYITVDAEAALRSFMVNGWPDDARFHKMVEELLARARRNGRRVRAFGEMVAVLWACGSHGATVRLEHLWHQLCHRETLALLCAYPKSGFTQDAQASIQQIQDAHSKVLPGATAVPHFSIV